MRSVMTTALDSDERLHSEVSLKQEQGYVRHIQYAFADRYPTNSILHKDAARYGNWMEANASPVASTKVLW